MMYQLLANIALKIIGMFINKAAEKAAWEKAIKERMRELDASAGEASTLRDQYDEAMQRLKDRQNGTTPKV